MPTHPQNTCLPAGRRLLITAGPTHEPIDAVRYIGNRSSGRLGIALADRAAATGWKVTLLLGPTDLIPSDSQTAVIRFRTTAELDASLRAEFARCDVLIMAAAVADYRPKLAAAPFDGKLKRDSRALTLELEPTPDLLAGVAAGKRSDQLVVGFALEPADRLMESAAAKLSRKGLDMIVANPLATMESAKIEATILKSDGTTIRTDGPIGKDQFAKLLLTEICKATGASVLHTPARTIA